MDLDAGSVLASLLVSGAGFVAFSYGKRQGRVPQMAAGVLLMVFPYFCSGPWVILAIGAALLALLAGALRLGL